VKRPAVSIWILTPQRIRGIAGAQDAANPRLRRGRRPPQPGRRRHACSIRGAFPGLKRHFARSPGDGRTGLRRPPRPVRPGVRAGHGQFRPRSHHRVRLQSGLDSHTVGVQYILPAAICRHCRQHGPARRRNPRPARPRLHPGVHVHPPCSTCYPATCPCRSADGNEDLDAYVQPSPCREILGNTASTWSAC